MIYRHPDFKGQEYPNFKLRQKLVRTYKRLISLGLNRGTSGNCSVRIESGDGLLITPSGVPVDRLSPASIVEMRWDGHVAGEGTPSSEWRFHLDILKHRPDVNAVVHTHSIAATAISCLRKDIPAFHYMIAVAGGDSIRCAPYALFGSQELSEAALIALDGRKACLLANHGLIALGKDLNDALQIAIECETLAEQYLLAQNVSGPFILSKEEMDEVSEMFKNYGFQKPLQS